MNNLSRSSEAFDFMKTISIIVMIFVHCSFWIVGFQDMQIKSSGYLFDQTQKYSFLGLFPMLLPILAGLSFKNFDKIAKKTMRLYGIILIALGFIFHYIIWGINVRLEWDILQFLGLCILILSLKDKRKYLVLISALSCLGIWPLLKDSQFFDLSDNFFAQIFLGSLESGPVYWPLLPWYPLVAFGYLLNTDFLTQRNPKSIIVKMLLFMSLFTLFYSYSKNLFVINSREIWGPSFFRPETSTQLAIICLFISFFLFSWLLVDKMSRSKKITALCRLYSKSILWIYLSHQFIALIIVEDIFPRFNLNELSSFTILLFSLLLTSHYIAKAYAWISQYKITLSLKKT